MAYTSSDTIRAIIAAAKGVAGEDWLYLAQAMLAVAWMESSFDPEIVGDYGTSFGIFQLHIGGGQGDAFVAKYGKEALFNPYLQAPFKAGQMRGYFPSMGGKAALLANPGNFINDFEWVTQSPLNHPGYDRSYSAWQTAVKAASGDWSDITPAETDPWPSDTTPPADTTEEQTQTTPFTIPGMASQRWLNDFQSQPMYDPVQALLSGLGASGQ